jgi:hypothetical protein
MSRKRRNSSTITKHHRMTRSQGCNPEDIDNISFVTFGRHSAYNQLFDGGNMPPKDIAKELSEVWIRPDWEIVALPKHLNCQHCATCKLEEVRYGCLFLQRQNV